MSGPTASLFETHILVHTHIGKCGGGSINGALRTLFGKDRVLIRKANARKTALPELLTPEQRADTRAYLGHFPFGDDGIALFGRRPLYIASVRDPLSRLESFYVWAKGNPGNEHHGQIGDGSFDEVVRRFLDTDHVMTRNGQCLQLCGKEDFKAARRNIRDNYLALVDVSGVDGLIAMLTRAFGADVGEHKRRHVREREPLVLSAEAKAAFRARTAEDARLAAWAARSQDQWLARAERTLRGRLRRPRDH